MRQLLGERNCLLTPRSLHRGRNTEGGVRLLDAVVVRLAENSPRSKLRAGFESLLRFSLLFDGACPCGRKHIFGPG